MTKKLDEQSLLDIYRLISQNKSGSFILDDMQIVYIVYDIDDTKIVNLRFSDYSFDFELADFRSGANLAYSLIDKANTKEKYKKLIKK